MGKNSDPSSGLSQISALVRVGGVYVCGPPLPDMGQDTGRDNPRRQRRVVSRSRGQPVGSPHQRGQFIGRPADRQKSRQGLGSFRETHIFKDPHLAPSHTS